MITAPVTLLSHNIAPNQGRLGWFAFVLTGPRADDGEMTYSVYLGAADDRDDTHFWVPLGVHFTYTRSAR